MTGPRPKRLQERGRHTLGRARRRNPRSVAVLQGWLRRFIEIEGVDRSIILAAQAFTALFPLLIVFTSVTNRGDGTDFAGRLIDRFSLGGAAAADLQRAFAPPNDVEGGVTFATIAVLALSALAFARSLQRTYERSWRLPPLKWRGTKWGLLWLGAVAIAYSVRPALQSAADGGIGLILTFTTSAVLWLLTPYILLARRLPWRRLVPSALLTAVALTGLTMASVVYVPYQVASSAERFGLIGVAFALLGWLLAAGVAVNVAATGGAVLAEHLDGRGATGPAGPDTD